MTAAAAESELCGAGDTGKLTRVGFSSATHRIPQDFWHKGVDKSKFVLETILNKIKFFEEVSESTWVDLVRENFALENLQIQDGEFEFLICCCTISDIIHLVSIMKVHFSDSQSTDS